MGLCGFAACPSDAVEAIKQRAHYIATAAGGNGAVREIAEIILQAQGKPCTLPEQW
jgi:3-deoxy-D-manno-octulosonate 8-phosphate phosphatase (KDO 8-P phosphatase)